MESSERSSIDSCSELAKIHSLPGDLDSGRPAARAFLLFARILNNLSAHCNKGFQECQRRRYYPNG